MATIQIGSRQVGDGHPCFVIAEAGINHNGDAVLAKGLVLAAAEAGADAIKFQTHLPEHQMLRDSVSASYIGESVFDLLTRTALTVDAHVELRDLAAAHGVLFMSTPFSREAADFLETLDVPVFKTGSGELTNVPLQQHIAKKRRPMIVSTGMSTVDEIDRAVAVVREAGIPFALMHCTSTYPTPFEHVQLDCIGMLKDRYDVPAGFSDHTLGPFIGLAAVAKGANLLEKHFTMSRSLPGPDQPCSIEPAELADLIKGIRAIERAGGGRKELQPGEEEVRRMAHHSVVTLRAIAAGTTVDASSVWVKRPGTGIPAHRLQDVIGRTARRAIEKDRQIAWDDLIV